MSNKGLLVNNREDLEGESKCHPAILLEFLKTVTFSSISVATVLADIKNSAPPDYNVTL